jgi:hypothetical protein
MAALALATDALYQSRNVQYLASLVRKVLKEDLQASFCVPQEDSVEPIIAGIRPVEGDMRPPNDNAYVRIELADLREQ